MKKILIIEDELNIFELIKFNLEAQGFEVAGVHEGTGAVEKIVDIRPDLIILDLMLPGKDGLTICREVRADKNLSYIPVIMLTAKSEEFDKVLGPGDGRGRLYDQALQREGALRPGEGCPAAHRDDQKLRHRGDRSRAACAFCPALSRYTKNGQKSCR